jgi:hypothetical protein
MDDDLEIDPAMAEAMGFTSFGSKRRKHTARNDDAFVDDSHLASTGANNMPLGTRAAAVADKPQTQQQAKTDIELAWTTAARPEVAEQQEEKEQQDSTTLVETTAETIGNDWTAGLPSPQELAALRRGIRNARGDMVVFMPSFIDDPWKALVKCLEKGD